MYPLGHTSVRKVAGSCKVAPSGDPSVVPLTAEQQQQRDLFLRLARTAFGLDSIDAFRSIYRRGSIVGPQDVERVRRASLQSEEVADRRRSFPETGSGQAPRYTRLSTFIELESPHLGASSPLQASPRDGICCNSSMRLGASHFCAVRDSVDSFRQCISYELRK